MPYVIELTDLCVENIQIFKEMDDEGNFAGLNMSLNATLLNENGDSEGKSLKFELTEQQETQVRNFVKPFVRDAAAHWGVNSPPWAE